MRSPDQGFDASLGAAELPSANDQDADGAVQIPVDGPRDREVVEGAELSRIFRDEWLRLLNKRSDARHG
jgi:hypothetical protein